jgi:hypothetical protein
VQAIISRVEGTRDNRAAIRMPTHANGEHPPTGEGISFPAFGNDRQS